MLGHYEGMAFYTKLARAAAEHFVRSQELLPLPPLPPDCLQQRACYVAIYEKPGRRLRSMSGSTLPRQPTLAEEIVANTIAAITETTRQVRRGDLASLSYSVALVGSLARISDPVHLDPARFGLYVRSDRGKSAVVLPQRAGVETAHDQIGTAIREANINVHHEATLMYRFTVDFYDE